jgi:glycosyltransferase involved in cell wall biosynthesis
MSKIKVLILADGSSPHTKRWICPLISEDYEFLLVSFNKVKFEDIKSIYIDSFKQSETGGNYKLIFNLFKIRKVIKEFRPDIIHAHYATSYGLIGAILSKEIPFMLTCHGSDALITPKKNFLYNLAFRFTVKKAKRVTVVSMNILDNIFKMGIRHNNIVNIYNSVDTSIFFLEKDHSSRISYSFVSSRNFEQIYNHEYFVNIFNRISKAYPESSIKYAGNGSELEKVQSLVSELDLNQKVEFSGFIHQVELAKLYNNSIFYVSASLSDGSSAALLDAMSCGCIPIVSDIPANREFIVHKINGILFPLNNEELASKEIIDCLPLLIKNYINVQNFNKMIISTLSDLKTNNNLMLNEYINII